MIRIMEENYEAEGTSRYVVILRNKRRFSFEFDGFFTLEDYLNKQKLAIGDSLFLRVANDDDTHDTKIVNTHDIVSIELYHE